MSRTKRAYNRRPIGGGYSGPVYHPYKQLCMGHCRGCKVQFIEEARKRARWIRERFKFETEEA